MSSVANKSGVLGPKHNEAGHMTVRLNRKPVKIKGDTFIDPQNSLLPSSLPLKTGTPCKSQAFNSTSSKVRYVCGPTGWPLTPVCFCSMKRLRIQLFLPGWDASPSQGDPQHYDCQYIFMHLGEERQSGVKFLV